MKYRCLSIRQPHLQALLDGRKDVEYRTWQTAYRGPLLLHAGLRLDGADVAEHYGYPLDRWYDIGAILALCRLADIVRGPEPGLFSWLLSDIRELAEPIPYVGRLGLFTVDDLPPGAIRLARRRRRA
jgi:hypothetical protein